MSGKAMLKWVYKVGSRNEKAKVKPNWKRSRLMTRLWRALRGDGRSWFESRVSVMLFFSHSRHE